MESSDITIEILKDIRGEIRELRGDTNARLDETNRRLDESNRRMDDTNDRLDTIAQRVVESEMRTATAIADLAGTVREMTQVLRASHDLRPRVERCEQDIAEIKRTMGTG
jgi:chromosome segregation ATPase